ncbi:hypothetical protein J6590_084992 [Homalodisca vitripennis]|nr:hypothetical protein J6590_084992 [Homalodisca vitripennis]
MCCGQTDRPASYRTDKIQSLIYSLPYFAWSWRAGGRTTSKMRNNEGEEEVEDGIRKATFGSASACVRVRGKIF